MEIMKKRILILWAKWMLWNAIYKFLNNKEEYELVWTISWDSNDYITFFVDENYISNIKNILKEWKFDYVLNCIWFIRPDITSICDYNRSLIINSHFPKTLQNLSYKYNYKLIHFSTDCIFNWEEWNYTEQSIPNELWIYWLSKYLWEINDEKNLTIRTSIIWIEQKNNSRNLLNWFLSLKEVEKIEWFWNVYWNWVTTLVIAKIINFIIRENVNITWLLQIWSEEISKYDLLQKFSKIFNKNILINKNNDIKSNKCVISSKKADIFNDYIKSIDEQILDLKEFYNI